MDGAFKTDIGLVRSINEDAGEICLNEHGQTLAIVADGMGGHKAGEVASQLAVQIAKEYWQAAQHFVTPVEAENWLKEVIDKMNETIYEHAQTDANLEGMGTTVVLVIAAFEFITVAHVGDSRCYLMNEDKMEQLTTDHSLVNELIRTGQITEDDAEEHPRKNVLIRAIGTEPTIDIDIQTLIWEKNDQILLCSDGLTNKITNEELEEHLRADKSLQEKTSELVDLANERGGEDNITLAILQNTSQDEVGDLPC